MPPPPTAGGHRRWTCSSDAVARASSPRRAEEQTRHGLEARATKMSASTATNQVENARRIEELGRIIIAYSEVLEQAVEFATARTPRASVRVLLEGEPHLRVVVDPLLMGQAVLNLLLNATEAIAPETRGTVTVRFSRPPGGSDARQFHLSVTDTG